MKKTQGIVGVVLATTSFIAFCIKLFGDFPPDNFNYVILGGICFGAMLSSNLFEK